MYAEIFEVPRVFYLSNKVILEAVILIFWIEGRGTKMVQKKIINVINFLQFRNGR